MFMYVKLLNVLQRIVQIVFDRYLKLSTFLGMMIGWVTNMGSNPEKNFIEILCIQMINQLCAGQNQKEFSNLDIWMSSYEAIYSSKIKKIMSLYYIVGNFFVLKKYNPIHQPRNLVLFYMRVRCGVTFSRVRQGPAKKNSYQIGQITSN